MGSKNLFYLILLLFLTIFPEAVSQPNREAVIQCATAFLSELQDQSGQETIVLNKDFRIVDAGQDLSAYAFDLEPAGFIIVTDYGNSCKVAGYSLENDFSYQDQSSDRAIYAVISAIAGAHKNLFHYKEADASKSTSAAGSDNGPFIEAMWGQVNCKDEQNNIINVTNLFTPNHYAAGCVAISLATILHHYKWPDTGMGAHEYTDNQGSSTGTYSADFGNTQYDMQAMKNLYNHVSSEPVERVAAGELTLQAAVALEMDFEYNGSTSNVNMIPRAGMDYFRYHSYYKDIGSAIFWDRLDKNMLEKIPVILSIKADNGAGHSIVCDGLNITEDQTPYYHLNMGWWGAGNGWFTIRDNWQSGGYSQVVGAVLDMFPVPQMHEVESIADDQVRLMWSTGSWPVSEMFEIQMKKDFGSWITVSQDITDTSLIIDQIEAETTYFFRVRARMNGDWFTGSWSNFVSFGEVLSSGLEQVHPLCLTIYPNPFQDQLFVKGMQAEGIIEALDMTGKVLFKQTCLSEHDIVSIPSGSWPRGIYVVRYVHRDQKSVKKIIKY